MAHFPRATLELMARRHSSEIQRNGAYWETTYDDAKRWTLRSFYSAGNTLLATNRTERDRRGNVIRTVDAAGFRSTNVWDHLDRRVAVFGPVVKFVLPPGVPSVLPYGIPTNV